MKNILKLLSVTAFVLVIGMTVIGCEDEEDPPPPPPPQPGDSWDNPINRVESIDLGDMTEGSGWRQLVDSIKNTGKYINLDLSACTMTGTSFDPYISYDDVWSSKGEDNIVSLILPNVATSIAAGNSSASAFRNFHLLKSISGANITTIGDYAFDTCSYLIDGDFPEVTTINAHAFGDIKTLNIPKVTSIGSYAFYASEGLTITMGATAPSLQSSALRLASYLATTVKVKVPSGATGYTPFTDTSVTVSGSNSDVNWANGFRGAGWNGSAFRSDTSYIHQGISLTIEQQ